MRRLALDPSQSFIVEAPAGSGKTELLMQRYLRLLGAVEQPECVVAVTFTRKAAAEMRERIVSQLREADEQRPLAYAWQKDTRQLAVGVLAADRERGWGLLGDGSRLQVQTLDALCALLARQMPFHSGLGATPEVIEDASELYRVAARRAIARLAEGNESEQELFRYLALHFGSDLGRLEHELAVMLTRRDQWRTHFAEALVSDLPQIYAGSLRRACERILSRAHALWPESRKKTIPAEAERISEWRALADTIFRKDGKLRTSSHGWRDVVAQHPDFIEALRVCQKPPPAALSAEQQILILSFLLLLKGAERELRDVFGERGQVDFSEITSAASQALGSESQPTELAFRLDYRIEHLLVDEFQDTSLAQYELIRKLTGQWSLGDGRTLFVVGDPMQSIYRFRNAEVELFLRAQREGIGAVPLRPLRLQVNFRSAPAIVQWVNQHFQRVFCCQDDSDYGGVALRPSLPVRNDRLAAPQVHFFFDDDGTREAAQIATLAAEYRARNEHVAILLRSREHGEATLAALRRGGIPYRAVDIASLAGEQHIIDVLSLARALVHVGDRVAWLACVRAPWCGLTVSDLAKLAGSSELTVLEALRDADRIAQLSSDGRARALACGDILAHAVESRGRFSVRRLVEGAWLALAGPATLADEAQRHDVNVFFQLLERFDQGGTIADFSLLESELERLYAQPRTQADNPVEILTMHGAKGLEFDVVLLPQLHRRAAANDRQLVIWNEVMRADGGADLILAAKPERGTEDELYAFVSAELKRKDDYERQRVLYVAATRARHRLHLFAALNRKKDGDLEKPSSSLLGLLWPALEEEALRQFDEWKRQQGGAEQFTMFGEAIRGVPLRRLPAGYVAPRPGPSYVPPELPARKTVAATAIPYHWASDVGRHAGTIVHRMLLRIAAEGLGVWSAARLPRLLPRVQAELRQLGLSGAELRQASERIEHALMATLNSERGRWILSGHDDARSECAISGMLGGALVSGGIDRTFRDEHGRRWIIDYKTSEHEGGSVDSFLAREKARYRDQLESYAALLRAQTGDPEIMLGLYFPLLDQWLEWEYLAQAGAASRTLVTDGG